eukprot:scaffold117589_cov13-Tisochrysis_lutea.AAC.1
MEMLRYHVRTGVERCWACIRNHRATAQGFSSAASFHEPDIFDPHEICHWVNPQIEVQHVAG